MTRVVRLSVAAVAATASVLAIAATPASAQTSCGSLPNPIIVAGSTALESVLTELSVRAAYEMPPASIIVPAIGSLTTSCAGIASVVNGADLGGAPGRYYTRSGTAVVSNTCAFDAGQKVHVAVSDVFYESCPDVPQPKPADITDVPGPVQTTAFVVRRVQPPVQYLTYEEARGLYGCGVSGMASVAGFADATRVFCRDPNSGPQITIARNIGVPESRLVLPRCSSMSPSQSILRLLLGTPTTDPPRSATADIAFVPGGLLDENRTEILPLAFQALGQTRAYTPDSGPDASDRRNVRDGHYPLWSYEHLIAKTSGGNLSPQAADLIGLINGTKTIPTADFVLLEASAGLVPQCAMKVQRTSDGGLLGRYTPPASCNCWFEAVITRGIPPTCTPCVTSANCSGGLSCRFGFCE